MTEAHRSTGGAAKWLRLSAAPTFAVMALLSGVPGDNSLDVFCSMAHGASPLTGMTAMYVLMSVFHVTPWLNLIFRCWERSHPPTKASMRAA